MRIPEETVRNDYDFEHTLAASEVYFTSVTDIEANVISRLQAI